MNKLRKIDLIGTVIIITVITAACGHPAQPRPKGYFRIDLPEKGYVTFDSLSCPFTFEYPSYGKITQSNERNPEPWWFNIEFQKYKAKIHISYKEIKGNLPSLLEDNYTLTYNHTIKADAIRERVFSDTTNSISGLLYDLKGNTATAVQFYVTDSTNHFLRGSLYFFAPPNADSLQPVIEFFREDIIHLMESVRWRN
jgi:gliding motility-associated lipoprotein GldD